jgi:hypothetical protein
MDVADHAYVRTQEARMAAAFNEWMRLFTEEPEKFEREFRTVQQFLLDKEEGREPSYGTSCAAFLVKLMADAR